jgi:hypothetical protein
MKTPVSWSPATSPSSMKSPATPVASRRSSDQLGSGGLRWQRDEEGGTSLEASPLGASSAGLTKEAVPLSSMVGTSTEIPTGL